MPEYGSRGVGCSLISRLSLRRACAVAALWIVALGAHAQGADVADAFAAYRTAILASDGEAALGTVDAGSVAYYEEMLDLALDGDSVAVTRLPVLDEMLVIALRVRVPADTLRQMDGRSVLVYGVDQGWIGRESVERMALGRVDVSGDRARGSVVSGGRSVPKLHVAFSRDDGRWRFDLRALQTALSAQMTPAIKQEGLTDADLIETLLSPVLDKPFPSDAWQPVGR